LHAYNVTLVEYRPIGLLSAECRLPLLAQAGHLAAQSLCDSWTTCLLTGCVRKQFNRDNVPLIGL